MPVCASSRWGMLISFGARQGEFGPVGDSCSVTWVICVDGALFLFLVFALAVKAMAILVDIVLQQWKAEGEKIGCCSRQKNASKKNAKFLELSAGLESVLSDGFISVVDRVGNFHPSWEKFRVMLMTIADGAMSSETLYEF